LFDPTFVGTFDVFSNENPETCSNCSKHLDWLSTTLYTSILLFCNQQEKLHSMRNMYCHTSRSLVGVSRRCVVFRYSEALDKFFALQVNGEVVDLKKVPSLKVSIDRTHLTLPTGAVYPKESRHVLYKGNKDGHWKLEV
jgi:hypothetical protein